MLALVLALSLGQVEATPPAAEPAVEAPQPLDFEPLPPAPPLRRRPPETPVFKRVLLSGVAAVGASGAALGLSLLLTGANPRLDNNFATAMLAPILITGVGFAVHQALGGHGEPILAYFLALGFMAGAAGLAAAIDGTTPLTPILTTVIGSVPAAAAAIWVLEGTTPKRANAPRFALAPTGFALTF